MKSTVMAFHSVFYNAVAHTHARYGLLHVQLLHASMERCSGSTGCTWTGVPAGCYGLPSRHVEPPHQPAGLPPSAMLMPHSQTWLQSAFQIQPGLQVHILSTVLIYRIAWQAHITSCLMSSPEYLVLMQHEPCQHWYASTQCAAAHRQRFV